MLVDNNINLNSILEDKDKDEEEENTYNVTVQLAAFILSAFQEPFAKRIQFHLNQNQTPTDSNNGNTFFPTTVFIDN